MASTYKIINQNCCTIQKKIVQKNDREELRQRIRTGAQNKFQDI